MPARGTRLAFRPDSRCFIDRAARVAGAALLLAGAALQSGCGLSVRNGPINAALAEIPGDAPVEAAPPLSESNFEDTVVGLSFSGGGTRASAFAFGVLRELSRTQISSGDQTSALIDQVDLVSSVSGGSVTAAYFALKGKAMLEDFEAKFLSQDVEESLRTSVSPLNIVRLTSGGVNDSTGLQTWLDENLFKNATFGDVLRRRRPTLWINASDIYNRTAFVFNQSTFGALCSDLSTFPLSEAVAASAAVPIVFAPVVIRNYGDRCQSPMPEWAERALGNSNSASILRANAEAIKRYREHSDVKYVKLLDGGLTDNLGLTGMLLARLGANAPYEPMSEREAVRMRRLLFIVVDAGRPPGGDWAKSVNTDASDLIQAVADTAVDANVRNTYDTFAAQLKSWNRELVDWRCKLPLEKARAMLDTNRTWNCKDLSFHVVKGQLLKF